MATVIGAIFAALTYFSGKNNEVDTNVPNRIKKQADKLELSIKKPIYQAEKNWLAAMFYAADEMPTYAAQIEAFAKVVDAALDVDDLNVAILAMREMPTYASKEKMIYKIVDHSVLKKETLAYGLTAAKDCPTYACKQKALSNVIDAYSLIIKKESKGTKKPELKKLETIEKSPNKANAADAKRRAAD